MRKASQVGCRLFCEAGPVIQSQLPAAASGRKWRIRPQHIRLKAMRGATKATSIAAVKLARTMIDQRLAMRRVCRDTCVESVRINILCSKTL